MASGSSSSNGVTGLSVWSSFRNLERKDIALFSASTPFSPCSSKNSFLCRCRVSIVLVRIWGSLSLIVKYANDLKRKGSKFPYWEEMIKYLLFLNKHKVLKNMFVYFYSSWHLEKKISNWLGSWVDFWRSLFGEENTNWLALTEVKNVVNSRLKYIL